MTEAIQAALITSGYRLITMLIGCVIVFLGYRLFSVGMFQNTTDLKAAWGEKNLTLKQASPGIFFALFGASIIATSLWRGVSIEQTRTQSEMQSQSGATLTTPKQPVISPPSNAIEQIPKETSSPNITIKPSQKTHQPNEQAKSPIASKGESSTIKWAFYGGKGSGANESLSNQLRRVLSDQALCLHGAIDENARESCHQNLLKKVKAVPQQIDINTIEELEQEYLKNPNPKTMEALLNMKFRFLR